MLKIVASTVLGCCSLICSASEATACGGGCACPCATATMSMPMPASMPGMPGMPAHASAATQYRTYSYQPAAPVYRSYSAPTRAAWDYPKTDARRYSGGR
jgi:hypothetical protein